MSDITKQSALAKLIQGTKLLVWDQAPMMDKHAAECIDRTLRDLCSNDLPSGGKVFAFGGDLRQILSNIRWIKGRGRIQIFTSAPCQSHEIDHKYATSNRFMHGLLNSGLTVEWKYCTRDAVVAGNC